MLPAGPLASALASIQLIALHGPWWRAIGHRHTLAPPPGRSGNPQVLWGGSASVRGARFTPPGGFDSVYLTGDPVTALAEVRAIVLVPGGIATLQTAPWTVVIVNGAVGRVLDLTDAATLHALGTNEQEMTGEWLRASNPPTQVLARVAYDSGRIAGMKYGSVKHPGGVNLVVFPDRLVPPSTDFLEVFDPHGNLAQRIGA